MHSGSGLPRAALTAGIVLLLSAPVAAMTPALFLAFFDAGSSRLSPQAKVILDSFATAYHREHAGVVDSGDRATIIVEGRTDRIGDPLDNLRLSCRRASAVRDYLFARGIPEDRITIRGYGEYGGLIDTADGVAEPQNRFVRVDLATYHNPQSRLGAVPVRCEALLG